MKIKICHKCGETKPLSDFYVHSSKNGTRKKRGACKVCMNKQNKKYRAGHLESVRVKATEKMRVWRSNPANLAKQMAGEERRRKASPRYTLNGAIHNARKFSVVSIDLEYLMWLWREQQGRCALTGIEMTWSQGGIRPTSISLDRIRHREPYERGNVRLVCYAINAFRQRMSDVEMVEMARAIIAKADVAKCQLCGGTNCTGCEDLRREDAKRKKIDWSTEPTWLSHVVHSESI